MFVDVIVVIHHVYLPVEPNRATMTQAAGQSGGLPPLEYSDCFLDSPTFREVVVLYEKEMESNYYLVKNLVRQCDSMIQATRGA